MIFKLPKGDNADVAQLVEHNLAKVGVAGSSPVSRSVSVVRSMRGTVANQAAERGG